MLMCAGAGVHKQLCAKHTCECVRSHKHTHTGHRAKQIPRVTRGRGVSLMCSVTLIVKTFRDLKESDLTTSQAITDPSADSPYRRQPQEHNLLSVCGIEVSSPPPRTHTAMVSTEISGLLSDINNAPLYEAIVTKDGRTWWQHQLVALSLH